MSMTATSLVWDPFVTIGGTSLQGYYRPAAGWPFEETVARLKAASGQEPSDGAGDKTSVEVVGRFDGAVFALYDYKGDRELHIGGHGGLAVARLQAALDAALAAVDPAPYRAVEPEAYGGVHGWPV